MIRNVPSVFLVFAPLFLISSAYSLNPPVNYTWPKNTQKLCFAARFDFVLNVEYSKSDGTKTTAVVPLDNTTYESYSVSCSELNDVHELTISMLGGFSAIIFDFSVNKTNMTTLNKVYGYITFNDKQKYFKDYSPTSIGVHKFSSNQSLFTADRGNSFRCFTKTKITGFEQKEDVVVQSIDIDNLRIQPFADDAKDFTDFAVEKVCSADIAKNSNVIPIIVGSCLAALIVIVLVAYLIGRRRSRKGYQSV